MVLFHRRPISDQLIPVSYHESPLFLFYSPSENEATACARSGHGEKNCKKECSTQKQNKSSVSSPYKKARIHSLENLLTLELDVPGVKSDGVQISFHESVVTVDTVRSGSDAKEDIQKSTHRFLVNEKLIEHDKFQASLKDGVLTITVPKSVDAVPEAIPIATHEAPEPLDDDHDFRFAIDLPGVKSSDLKLEVKHSTIHLHAERKIGERVSSIDKHFEFTKTTVDAKGFKAFLVNGVLTVVGLKKEAPEPQSIQLSDTLNLPLPSPNSHESDVVTETTVTESHASSKKEEFVVVETVAEN